CARIPWDEGAYAMDYW
nr:immunoglobulin heavy chain junction region [Mus musculus]